MMDDGRAETLTWRLMVPQDIRVPVEQFAAAHNWYSRWFVVHSLVPGPTYVVGDAAFHLLPRESRRDSGHSVLALAVDDALRVATNLIAEGARLSYPVLEWEDRFQVECVDSFGTCWRLVQDVPNDITATRRELRRFAALQRGAIQRLGGLPNVGRAAPFIGLVPYDEGRATLYCEASPPSALGPPHYEEYEGYRTTGEPWFFWAFASDGMQVVLQYSSVVKSGRLWCGPAHPEAALAALGLPASEWTDAQVPGSRFRVMRQDDNGNVFEVAVVESEWTARRRVEEMESLGHKQHYWLEAVLAPAAK